MTPELTYLVWSVALTVILVVVSAAGAQRQVGMAALAGNREGAPELTGWAGRAIRAHRNMLENLVLFAILVLTCQAAGVRNSMTLLGAELFFWGRVAHAVCYILGLIWVRTLVFGVSVAGLVLLFVQLIR
ncbi:MAG: MAPEG family protein [Sciscionella sp.]